jgi:uncharacterized membrane protein (DUF4010 family)
MIAAPWLNFLVAIGIGLLVGIERERSKGEGPSRRPAGIRTFTIASLLGAAGFHLGGTPLLAIVIAAVTLLVSISYWHSQDTDPGLTTEIGLVASPVLGGLAMSDPLLASALAAMVAVIFAIKAPLHRFVKGVLTADEVSDGLMFAIATLVVWPQLPDRYMGPFQALNPHTLWLLVVLVLAIGASGHVATRMLGSRFGLPLSGFASGFVSSTATIGALASHAAKNRESMAAAVAGATLSTVATFVQMAILLWATSQAALLVMAPVLVAGGSIAAVYGLAFTLFSLKSVEPIGSEAGRALSLQTAFALVLTIAVMLVLTAALKDRLGEAGMIAGAALAGAVDTHAAAISLASLVAGGKMSPPDAVLPIVVAMTTNAMAKMVMAIVTGTAGFAVRIIPGIVISMIGAWAAAFVVALA